MPRALPPAEALTLVPLADIAKGGMGSVQLCRVDGGRLGGRALAVKRLNPELERDPQFVNMFLDEMWMTAAIRSPHVIHVEAWGEDAQGHYLAVELVEGVSLSRLSKESRAAKEPFSERTVAFVLSQICAGLEAAHALTDETGAPLEMVHRDLTPGNILVGFDGLVKIADFGIAKANARLTQTTAGTMKGKPSYMAPEQARGFPVDARADLFSLGVIAYELLAGTRPWVGATDFEVLLAVSSKEPADLSSHRKVDPVFLEITRTCLQKDRDKRFRSAAEIRQRLDAWRRARGFEADDPASLASFVRRNTPKQLDWFQRALAGTQRGGATFKDVEDQIDQARRPSKSQDPKSGPRGGIPTGTMPLMPPPAGSLTSPESAVRPVTPGAVPVPSAPPRRDAPEVDDLAKTRMVVDDLAATRMVDDLAQTRMVEPRGRAPVGGLGGTVAYSPDELAKGPRQGPAGQPAPPPPVPQSPISGSGGAGDLGLPPPRPGAAVGRGSVGGGSGPSSSPFGHVGPPSQRGWTGPGPSGPASQGFAPPPPSSARERFVFQSGPLPVAPKKGGAGKVVALLVLVFLLFAAASAAYFMRARLGLLR
jgi:serine/threonine-protein kinase